MRRVIIPGQAVVFSAWGMLMSDLRRDFFKTYLCDLVPANRGLLNDELGRMAAEAVETFAEDEVARDDVVLTPFVRLRYRNQDHSVEVPLPRVELQPADFMPLLASFSQQYKQEYSYILGAPVEVVGLHLVAHADIGKPAMPVVATSGRRLEDSVKETRAVDYDVEGIHPATIYDGSLLEAGMTFAGPAIVELSWTTVVVHPGDRIEIDRYANVHLIKD
jgi:N-methylhydantoinase A